MCESFTNYHICGHIYSKNVSRCSREIHRQVDRSISTTLSDKSTLNRTIAARQGCADQVCAGSFLKPTLCSECEKVGIISDWLKSDSKLRYEIVKEWQRMKRADFSTHNGYGWPPLSFGDESVVDCNPPHVPVTNTHATKSPSVLHNERQEVSPIDTMAPAIKGYITQGVHVEKDVGKLEEKIKQTAHDAVGPAERLENLKHRMLLVRMQMQKLTAQARSNFQPHDADNHGASLTSE